MEYRTFPCPTCRQIIDTTMQSCRACGAAIDPAAAASAADLQARVQQACGDANSTRFTASAMWVAFLLSFLPWVGCFFFAVNAATMVIVPYKLIQWRRRFGKLESPDPDLDRARTGLLIATILWGAMVVVNVAWLLFRLFVWHLTRVRTF
jgi:hypothetical protein